MFETTLQFKHSFKNAYPCFVNVNKGVTNNTLILDPMISHHITLQTHLPGSLPLGVSETYWCPCLQVCLPPLSPAVSTSLPPVCCSRHAPLTCFTLCSWWFSLRSQWTVSWRNWMFLYVCWLNSSVPSIAITHLCLQTLFLFISPTISATLVYPTFELSSATVGWLLNYLKFVKNGKLNLNPFL